MHVVVREEYLPLGSIIMAYCIQLAPLHIKYLFNYSHSMFSFKQNEGEIREFQQFHDSVTHNTKCTIVLFQFSGSN